MHIAESGPVGLGGGGEKGLEGGFSFSTSMSGGALTRDQPEFSTSRETKKWKFLPTWLILYCCST